MNVEIGAEAALFPGKEYISGIFLAVHTTIVWIMTKILLKFPFSWQWLCFWETRTAPTTSQAQLRNWPTILSGIWVDTYITTLPLLQARLYWGTGQPYCQVFEWIHITLFLGDKNSLYYKPGFIEQLANHIVRYFWETRTAPTTSQAVLRNWQTILSGIWVNTYNLVSGR